MAVTATLVANGSWTDFSAQTQQNMGTLTQSPAVGDRIFLVLGSTVAAGSTTAPGASGWGAIDTLFDNQGNVFHRDTPTSGVAAGDQTTAEIWSAYVKYTIPTTGYFLNVTPDSRGLSAWWKLIDVSGLAEASDGSTSPLDKISQNDNQPATTSWTTGTTATLTTSDTWCLAVHSVSGTPTAPWFTDTASFTRLGSDQSGAAPGSGIGLSVLTKEVVTTTGVASTGTLTGALPGCSVLATYKVAASTPTTTGIRPVVHTEGQTTSALSFTTTGVNTTGCDLLVVAAGTWHSGGQTSTITDSKSNTWHLVPVSVPATAGLAKMYVWYAWNPTVGAAHTVTVTSSASASEITVSLNGFSGSQTSADPLDQKNTHTATAATGTPGSVTVTPNGELYFAAYTEDAGTTTINTSGWVEPDDVATGQDLHTQWQVGAAQTVNPSVTFVGGSTAYAAVIGTFKAAPAGGTSLTPATIAATSSVTGSVQALKHITPATVAATSAMTGAAQRLATVATGAIAATSAITAAISKGLVPSAINATSTITVTAVQRLASLRTVAIAATSTIGGAISGGTQAVKFFIEPVLARGLIPGLSWRLRANRN